MDDTIISPDAVVCNLAQLKGSVTVGANTIIHPTCLIFAKNGPIVIGNGNIFEEVVNIINDSESTMYIGDNNLFEVGCEIRAKSVGNLNIFEVRSSVGSESIITDGCTVGICSKVAPGVTLSPNTVIYGPDGRRRYEQDAVEMHSQSMEGHVAHLRFLIVEEHEILKSTRDVQVSNTHGEASAVQLATVKPRNDGHIAVLCHSIEAEEVRANAKGITLEAQLGYSLQAENANDQINSESDSSSTFSSSDSDGNEESINNTIRSKLNSDSFNETNFVDKNKTSSGVSPPSLKIPSMGKIDMSKVSHENESNESILDTDNIKPKSVNSNELQNIERQSTPSAWHGHIHNLPPESKSASASLNTPSPAMNQLNINVTHLNSNLDEDAKENVRAVSNYFLQNTERAVRVEQINKENIASSDDSEEFDSLDDSPIKKDSINSSANTRRLLTPPISLLNMNHQQDFPQNVIRSDKETLLETPNLNMLSTSISDPTQDN